MASLGCYQEAGRSGGKVRAQAAGGPARGLPPQTQEAVTQHTNQKQREQSPEAISLFQLHRWDRPGQAGREDADGSGKMGALAPPPLTRNLGNALKVASPHTLRTLRMPPPPRREWPR